MAEVPPLEFPIKAECPVCKKRSIVDEAEFDSRVSPGEVLTCPDCNVPLETY